MAFGKNSRIEELITCVICREWYDEPRLLPCSHTYCLKCIDKIATLNSDEFSCPQNDGCVVSKNDIPSLTPNKAIQDLVALYGSVQRSNICTNCKSAVAEYKCDSCREVYFCTECYQNVHSYPIMQVHKQVSINEAIPEIIPCDKHPKKQLDYWCFTCEKIICVDCVLFNHKNHKYALKDDVSKYLEMTIDNQFESVQSSLQYRINQVDVLINSTDVHCRVSKLKVKEAMASIRDIINTHERDMLEKISAIQQGHRKQYEDYKYPLKNELNSLDVQKITFDMLVATNNHTKVLQMKRDYEIYINKTKAVLKSLPMPNKVLYTIEGLDQLTALKEKIEHYGRYIEMPPYRNSDLEAYIAQNRKKQKFNLNAKYLNDSDMKILADVIIESTTPTDLNLEKNQIGPHGAQYLSDALRMNQTLSVLCLDQNQIGPLGAEHIADALKTNRTLNTLYLGENQIGLDGARFIADALKINRTLITLGLEHNQIGQQGIEYIADALKVNQIISVISLDQNHIREKGAEYLANALKLNRSLTVLYINENQLGKEGVQYIADALKVNKTLTDVGLKHNGIGPEGAQYIAEALKINTTLTDLGLQQNHLGSQGTQYIADILKTNQTLRVLGLQQNNIGPQGAQYMADVLRINRTLTSLYLADNHIGLQGAQSIVDALKVNQTLTNIRLEKNDIGYEGIQQMQQILKHKKFLTSSW